MKRKKDMQKIKIVRLYGEKRFKPTIHSISELSEGEKSIALLSLKKDKVIISIKNKKQSIFYPLE